MGYQNRERFIQIFSDFLKSFTKGEKAMYLQPIIKPVSLNCNLSCTYCYYGPPRREDYRATLGDSVDKFQKMNDTVLRELIKQFAVLEFVPEFVWHGGEPLLAGLPFFQKVVDFQREEGGHLSGFKNVIQTNATLINRDWASFFAEHDFGVGVSFDGTQESNDKNRIGVVGQNSSGRVMNGIKILQNLGVNPSVICTVTNANIGKGQECYRFLRGLGVNKIKFSHLHERERFGELRHVASDPMLYAEFLLDVLDAWLEEDNPEVEVAEIRSVVNILRGGDDIDCIYAGRCGDYLTIEYDGSVSCCDTIGYPSERVSFGNICDGLKSITESDSFNSFQKQLQRLHEDKKQEPWYKFLSVGCLGDYPTSPITSQDSENTFAQSWMKFMGGVSERLDRYGL